MRLRIPLCCAAECALALVCWGLSLCARADQAPPPPTPPVTAIEFSGNDITRPETMLREMVIRVGDPAIPSLVERSRQAVQDLGLFRAVEAETIPDGDGVRLRITVHEKWYVIPLPRIEANADGDYGYGAQVRWNNLWGLNHTLRLLAVKRKLQENERQGQLSVSGSYSIPFIDDSRTGVMISGGHVSQDSLNEQDQHYDETFDSAEVDLTRSLSGGPLSQGWNIGAGLLWQKENASGQYAPAPQGTAVALVGSAAYNDLHYLIYSEQGRSFSVRYEVAQDGWGSDYGYSKLSTGYRQAWHLGSTPHQEAQLLGSLGSYFGGAPSRERNAFMLGGSSMLRGYDRETEEGDFYYYLSGEYLRPVIWDWLRVVAMVEVGSAYHTVTQTGGHPFMASVGLGLRLRVNWLVNIEVQAGAAMPLIDGHGVRLFAGSL